MSQFLSITEEKNGLKQYDMISKSNKNHPPTPDKPKTSWLSWEKSLNIFESNVMVAKAIMTNGDQRKLHQICSFIAVILISGIGFRFSIL